MLPWAVNEREQAEVILSRRVTSASTRVESSEDTAQRARERRRRKRETEGESSMCTFVASCPHALPSPSPAPPTAGTTAAHKKWSADTLLPHHSRAVYAAPPRSTPHPCRAAKTRLDKEHGSFDATRTIPSLPSSSLLFDCLHLVGKGHISSLMKKKGAKEDVHQAHPDTAASA